jgi:hypothetical protein
MREHLETEYNIRNWMVHVVGMIYECLPWEACCYSPGKIWPRMTWKEMEGIIWLASEQNNLDEGLHMAIAI